MAKDPFDGKKQAFLTVYWQYDKDRTQRGSTTTHIGDAIYPPLSNREMQDIVYAAKMAYAKVVRERLPEPPAEEER